MKARSWLAVCVLVTAVAAGSCATETATSEPFTLHLSPEFVQGAIPGAVTGLLVTITNEGESETPVVLTASVDGGQVSVEPGEIRQGEVAEVTVVADPAAGDRPLDITVTGRRGDIEQTAVRSTTLYAWEDDRGEYARDLLGLFTAWLAENQPELGITLNTGFTGSYVAPGLLVVSHYLFMSDDWELGLSWHIMVPPDDWAEIYLRPRNEPIPTLAFRLGSQQAALQDGTVTIEAVAAPPEVVR